MLLNIHDWIAKNLRNDAIAPLWWFWDRVMLIIEHLSPFVMDVMITRMEMDRQFHPERWERDGTSETQEK